MTARMQGSPDPVQTARYLRRQASELGFGRIGITGTDLSQDAAHLERWLALKRHGEMEYMARHGDRRTQPEQLVPGTRSVISVLMDYFPPGAEAADAVLNDAARGYVARYALGRDYHKVLRKRLQHLATRLESRIGPFGYRAFTDSAPVLERALARNAGLGWIGKHTNLINREHGSWFFIGEIYTDLELPHDEAHTANYCGSCSRCIEICPTGAIVAPYQLDARLCIAYLTIELKGAIPEALRPMIGNRIFGCDDCQLVCPWNRHARMAVEPDFRARHGLDGQGLLELFSWSEADFDGATAGSAIRRVGYTGWLRNVAVALGNCRRSSAPDTALQREIGNALLARQTSAPALVQEHIAWALAQGPGSDAAGDCTR
ncbi:MAG: tRNA epoxyqueuosine(34) reductase QueG [Gammaproteobacteria bacterium]|nr:tRNA epoxyqueuosine(34) reductase QueG [Gammaproteobacteria bacterium]NNM00143.1 tRNA epoxyqueuosine(34) reductase QueG [Gammaproteobacteria bacterium]